MAQASCKEVTLLLDKKFLSCERLLFHPMQSDFTTALAPDQLTAFLDRAAPAQYLYVDLASAEKIVLPDVVGGGKVAKSSPKAAPAKAPVASTVASVAHGFRDQRVADALSARGVGIVADPIGRLDSTGRLEGHSTHNFFVYDKKDKDKRMLITVARACTIDMKALPGLVGAKELRLCGDGEALLGSAKGCVTPLSLLYDDGRTVQWFVDDALLGLEQWRLGTSGEGTSPGSVADVPVSALQGLLGATGHWASKRSLDCRRWMSSAPVPARAVAPAAEKLAAAPERLGPRGLLVYDPCGDLREDFSRWYQPPYQTASGRVL
eukprot:TRINITY_DN19842_c0_g1_i2.p1 TRINITY_DN19842_c0_g1~~TRINITY_DN19842_c0_g1_i2.p1  ORF type:complete len:321 (-),score=77.03 TRINITY_DN19842_c0_g1_i2:131-1093(-)